MWNFSLFSRSQPKAAEQSSEKDARDESIPPADADPVEKESSDSESQTTPKASATAAPADPIPVLNLDGNSTKEKSDESSASNRIAKEQKQQPLNSTSTSSSAASNSSSVMGPPPPRLPQQQQQQPKPASSQTSAGQFLVPPKLKSSAPLRPPPSAAASLRAPPSSRDSRPTSSTLAPAQRNSSRKVVLEPGHSPLDWAALTSNPNNNLRGANLPPHYIRVTPSMLKAHNGRKGMDAWTSYKGKVYNITPYIPFHPGGRGEIMRGAGRDSGKLFMEVHPWVNWDAMLGECLVGILVSENDTDENHLNAMD